MSVTLIERAERIAGSLEDHFVSAGIERDPTPAIEVADCIWQLVAALSAAPPAPTPHDYQMLTAACYQMAGAYDAPERFLDALSLAAAGRPFDTENLLPVAAPAPTGAPMCENGAIGCAGVIAKRCETCSIESEGQSEPPKPTGAPADLVAIHAEFRSARQAARDAPEGERLTAYKRLSKSQSALVAWHPAAPALPPACLCCRDGCQDGCACKDMTRSDDESPRGRGALPPVEADTDLSALEQIDYVRRMLHWHTGPTAPAPYRGDHWAGEIDRLDAALEMLAPGRFTPLAMKPAPVEADTMPTIQVGDVVQPWRTWWDVVVSVDEDGTPRTRDGRCTSILAIYRDPLWRRPSPQEAPR